MLPLPPQMLHEITTEHQDRLRQQRAMERLVVAEGTTTADGDAHQAGHPGGGDVRAAVAGVSITMWRRARFL